MSRKKMKVDNPGAIRTVKNESGILTDTSEWISPTPHTRIIESVSSSFKPTEKSGSGEFSGSTGMISILSPKFNRCMLNKRFNPATDIPVVIGVRNPYALVNNFRNKIGESPYDWESMDSADSQQNLVTGLNEICSIHHLTCDQLKYDQLFDPAYESVLFSKMQPPSIFLATSSNKTCTPPPAWVQSTVPWTLNDGSPTFDGPIQGPADNC
jgi:hypothetical protein